jgi:hypothetical protein
MALKVHIILESFEILPKRKLTYNNIIFLNLVNLVSTNIAKKIVVGKVLGHKLYHV